MKKGKIFTIIAMAVAALFLTAGPVAAKGKKKGFKKGKIAYFTGTRCQVSYASDLEVYCDSDGLGRTIQTDIVAQWQTTADNKLVSGVWYNYGETDRENIQLPFGVRPFGPGYLAAPIEIYPDSVDGHWEGTMTLVFSGIGNFQYGVCQGKGDLEGLELIIIVENGEIAPNGISCLTDPPGWGEFNGIILDPKKDKKGDDDDD